MRATAYLVSTVILLAAAHTASAQQPNCQTVQFSDAVVEKFPRVREACIDVIERQGDLLAVFKADLLKVSGNKARIRARLPGGGHADPQTVQVDPQRRVLVNDKKYRIDELAIGQELTIYAKVDEPVAAFVPAERSENPEFSPIEVVPVRVAAAEPEMPTTANSLLSIGLSGVILMCLGVVLGLIRRQGTRWLRMRLSKGDSR
jgi:hypothetical protein